jgi:hypothetical protein
VESSRTPDACFRTFRVLVFEAQKKWPAHYAGRKPSASVARFRMSAAPEFDDERSDRRHDVSDAAESSSRASDAPTDAPTDAPFEPRARAAWQSWLSALATDAEAALAAALAYDSLDEDGKEAWLDVLEQDAPALGVPPLALYAPLLSVEADDGRRARMTRAVAPARLEQPHADEICAYRGVADDGTLVGVIVAPVYLDFVEVLTCRYLRDGGVVSADRDPLRHVDAFTGALQVDGLEVEPTPLAVVVDELAHAILADRRDGRDPPEALGAFAHLFAPAYERWGDDGG